MRVFVVEPAGENPALDDYESPRLTLDGWDSEGIYFFLYPELLKLRDETGQLIEDGPPARFDR